MRLRMAADAEGWTNCTSSWLPTLNCCHWMTAVGLFWVMTVEPAPGLAMLAWPATT